VLGPALKYQRSTQTLAQVPVFGSLGSFLGLGFGLVLVLVLVGVPSSPSSLGFQVPEYSTQAQRSWQEAVVAAVSSLLIRTKLIPLFMSLIFAVPKTSDTL